MASGMGAVTCQQCPVCMQGAVRTPSSAQRQLRKPPDTEPAWGMRARRTTGVSAAGEQPGALCPAHQWSPVHAGIAS